MVQVNRHRLGQKQQSAKSTNAEYAKSLGGDKGALLYGVTRVPRSASCGAWMPAQTVILMRRAAPYKGLHPLRCFASILAQP